MKHIKFLSVAMFALVLVVTSTPTASAYTSTSREALLAELQAKIVVLQAELARVLASQGSSQPVTTADVRKVYDNSVELKGVVAGTSGSSVTGWFEYGPTYLMQYSTPMTRVTAGRTFYGVADDIDSGRTYFYRAVTESRGNQTYGSVKTFMVTGEWEDRDDRDDRDEDLPDVTTDDADDIDETSAKLYGSVDMQDAENGIVFFAYGEDEDLVEDVEDENEYRDITEDGDDLQIVLVDSNFDSDEDFYARVTGLDDNTDHYFRICVEFEDEDNDEQLACGDVETFETE